MPPKAAFLSEPVPDFKSFTVPYSTLVYRLKDRGRLRYLWFELLFQLVFVVSLLVFLILQADTSMRVEVAGGLEALLAMRPFPAAPDARSAATFADVDSALKYTQWLANVAGPVLGLPEQLATYSILDATLRTVRARNFSQPSCPSLPASAMGSPGATSFSCVPGYSASADFTDDAAYATALGMPYSDTSLDTDVLGFFATYPASGYLRQIDAGFNAWFEASGTRLIDANTRFVGVSVVAHNPSYDMFVYAGFWAEFNENGAVATSTDYYCSTLHQSTPAEVAFASITGVLILVFVCHRVATLMRVVVMDFTARAGQGLAANLKAHVLSVWFVVDTVLVVFGVLEIVYIAQLYWSSWFASQMSVALSAQPIRASAISDFLRQYVSIQVIFGYTLILYTVLIFRYIAALRFFAKLDRVWQLVAADFVVAFVFLVLLLLFFALAGYLVFPVLLFRNILSALSTSFRMMYGEALTSRIAGCVAQVVVPAANSPVAALALQLGHSRLLRVLHHPVRHRHRLLHVGLVRGHPHGGLPRRVARGGRGARRRAVDQDQLVVRAQASMHRAHVGEDGVWRVRGANLRAAGALARTRAERASGQDDVGPGVCRAQGGSVR
jgi:hypothetical protein